DGTRDTTAAVRPALFPRRARAAVGLDAARRGIHAHVRTRHGAAALARANAVSLGAPKTFATLARTHAHSTRACHRVRDRLALARDARLRGTRSGVVGVFLR